MEPLTSADGAVRIVFHGDREDGKRACVYVSVWKYVSDIHILFLRHQLFVFLKSGHGLQLFSFQVY